MGQQQLVKVPMTGTTETTAMIMTTANMPTGANAATITAWTATTVEKQQQQQLYQVQQQQQHRTKRQRVKHQQQQQTATPR